MTNQTILDVLPVDTPEQVQSAARDLLAGLALPVDSAEEWRYSSIPEFVRAPLPGTAAGVESGADHQGEPVVPAAPVWGSLPAFSVIDFNVAELIADALPNGVSLRSATDAGAPPEGCDRVGVDDLGPDAFVSRARLDSSHQVIDIGPRKELQLAVIAPREASACAITMRIGSGAKVRVVIDDQASAAVSTRALRFICGEGCELTTVLASRGASSATTVTHLEMDLGARSTWQGSLSVNGGRRTRIRVDTLLSGADAEAQLSALYLATGEREVDLRTFQTHGGRGTKSKLDFRGVVAGQASAVYTGLVRIEEGASGSDAEQSNAILTLSDGAWAQSVPNLEIHNSDVRCAHASSVGPVDVGQIAYLESRGVKTERAEQLIVRGFVLAGLEGFALDAVRPALTDELLRELATLAPDSEPTPSADA